MTSPRWTTADIPALNGQLALVTGANSGLGYHTALELARKGACVLFACRSPERGQAALQEIHTQVPAASLELLPLDLADLASLRAASAELHRRYDRLDILVNNAGVMGIPRRLTAGGFEMQLGVNHLGHFALTGLLLDLLEAAPAGRVVTVSSLMHQVGRIDFADLMGERAYDPWRAYSQSKLANLLFAYELQRRLAQRGSP
ncbi:MAG: SDR family NAD(P)-dependent oxidoreductase, partial [Chloroflexota bacterium]